ncbi:hypothetical protein IWX49DRAFT_194168 [Phyllosticta citricarpa]|uniref:Uncharacterized protein n=2 Tax=Phyllosticta TaxID=121621 RepID=A0ABR1M5V9_9PEZI
MQPTERTPLSHMKDAAATSGLDMVFDVICTRCKAHRCSSIARRNTPPFHPGGFVHACAGWRRKRWRRHSPRAPGRQTDKETFALRIIRTPHSCNSSLCGQRVRGARYLWGPRLFFFLFLILLLPSTPLPVCLLAPAFSTPDPFLQLNAGLRKSENGQEAMRGSFQVSDICFVNGGRLVRIERGRESGRLVILAAFSCSVDVE